MQQSVNAIMTAATTSIKSRRRGSYTESVLTVHVHQLDCFVHSVVFRNK